MIHQASSKKVQYTSNKPSNKETGWIWGERWPGQSILSPDMGMKMHHDAEEKGADYQYILKLNQNNT